MLSSLVLDGDAGITLIQMSSVGNGKEAKAIAMQKNGLYRCKQLWVTQTYYGADGYEIGES